MTRSHLWNGLPYEERVRLMPYMIETHVRHLEQALALAVRAHRRHLREIDDWIENLKNDLAKAEREAE